MKYAAGVIILLLLGLFALNLLDVSGTSTSRLFGPKNATECIADKMAYHVPAMRTNIIQLCQFQFVSNIDRGRPYRLVECMDETMEGKITEMMETAQSVCGHHAQLLNMDLDSLARAECLLEFMDGEESAAAIRLGRVECAHSRFIFGAN
jgi:hypothetical protein